MPPIFASADIALLVAHFPPPLPTRTAHSLLVSKSDSDNLVISQKILSRFRRLVKSRDAGDTISLKDLPALLNVRETAWLLDCYDHDGGEVLRFTRDGRSIVTSPRFEDVMRSLQQEGEGFFRLEEFAARCNVRVDCFGGRELERWGLVRVPGEGDFVCKVEVWEKLRAGMRSLVEGDGEQEVVLDQRFPDVPSIVLRAVVHDVEVHADDIRGEFQHRGEGIVYVPLAFTTALQEKRKAKYDAEVETMLQNLEAEGYVHFPRELEKDSDRLLDDVVSKYSVKHTTVGAGISPLEMDDRTKVVVTQIRLDEIMGELPRILDRYMRSEDYDGAQVAIEKIEAGWFSRLEVEDARLVRLLVRSQYRDNLRGMIASKVEEIESEKRECFDKLFQEMVMALLNLYSTAILGDDTLRQNQDAFLTSHFRQQIIPGFVETVRRKRLLDDIRVRETNDLENLCKDQPPDSKTKQPRTFKDLHLAVTKFAKRQKIPPPTPEQLIQTQHSTLQQKLKAMEKIQRPSDVLQNVLWIAFSQAVGEGLFMSSGKDTSRMIEQYRLVENGRDEVWRKLVGWRDGIKSGSVGAEEMSEMKELAGEIVGEMEVEV